VLVGRAGFRRMRTGLETVGGDPGGLVRTWRPRWPCRVSRRRG
jgi:hypothetical protein